MEAVTRSPPAEARSVPRTGAGRGSLSSAAMGLPDPSPDFKSAADHIGLDGSLSSVEKVMSDLDRSYAIVLYALYQQVMVGKCEGPVPRNNGSLAHSMYLRWHSLRFFTPENAQFLFVGGVKKLYPTWRPGSRGSTVESIAESETQTRINSATSNETGILKSNGISVEAGSVKKAHDKVPGWKKGLNSVDTDDYWKSPFVFGQRPKPRYQHGSITMKNKMYVFGGNDGKSDLDDLHVLDFKSYEWSKLEPIAAEGMDKSLMQVAPRAGHRLILWNDKIVSVGGLSKDPCDTFRVEEFDAASCTWRTITTYGRPPTCRGGQSATLTGSRLVIFGGEDAKKSPLGDLYILDMKTLRWDNWRDIGDGPSPRSYHSAAGHADEHVFIFGGKSGVDEIFNDLWILDLEKRKWSKHEFEGDYRPRPRACHAGVTVGDKWFIVGGRGAEHDLAKYQNLELIEFNMSTRRLSMLTPIESRSGLASEGLSLVSTVHGGKYYIVSFGGYASRCNNDVNVLRLNCNSDGHTQIIERNHELSVAELNDCLDLSVAELNDWLDTLFSPRNFSDCSSESSEASVSSDLISEPDVSTNREEETGDTEGNKTSDTSVENRSSIAQLPSESTEDNRPNGKESSDNELRNCNQEKSMRQHSIAGENIESKRRRSPNLNKQVLSSDVPAAKKHWLEDTRFSRMGSLDNNQRLELNREDSETNDNGFAQAMTNGREDSETNGNVYAQAMTNGSNAHLL